MQIYFYKQRKSEKRVVELILLDKSENREELKEDIIDQIKYEKLDILKQDMIDALEIKYY